MSECKRKYRKTQDSINDHLINDTFNSSNFQEEQFDAIVIASALPNIEDDLKKLLKVGGRLFVVLGSKNQMHATLSFKRQLKLIGNLNLFLKRILNL